MNERLQAGWLTQKIDAFIRKYYQNKLLKGLLIIFGSALLYLLLLLTGEYFLYLSPKIKIAALLIPALIFLYALLRFIIYPLLQMMRLGKIISEQEAARIIGKHFQEVGDKLLNILQLKSQNIPEESRLLAEASIDQKSQELAPFRFTQAIDFKKSKKWLPLLLAPLAVAAIIHFWNPQIISQSSARLLSPATAFQKPAPFEFVLENKNLIVEQYGDLEVFVKLQGEAIPTQLNLQIDNQILPMKAEGKNRFSFTLRKVAEEKTFSLEAAGYHSSPYQVNLKYKPSLTAAEIQLNFPAYTQRKNETINGFSDLVVPEGTNIQYSINTRNVQEANLIIDGKSTNFVNKNNAQFGTQVRAQNDFSYSISLSGSAESLEEGNLYHVQVIKDQHPQIRIEQKAERISGEQILLTGEATDDYGLTKAQIVFITLNAEGKIIDRQSKNLELSAKNASPLQYYFDVATFGLTPGSQLQYFIEVWDNDAVNGAKSARSQIFTFKTVSDEDALEALEENKEELAKSLASGKEKMQELDEQLKKMQENQVNKNNLTEWEKQQNTQLLQEQQNVFREKMEEIQKRLEKQNELLDQKQFNENIQEKQESLEKQIDNLLNKELSEQMKKLQELLEQKNREMNMQDIQQMQQQNALFQMDLERIEEMIKQIEAQIMMEEMARQLEDLAQRQDQLNEKTDNNQTQNNEALAKEQQNLKNELEKLMQEAMKQLEEKADNQNLEDEKQAGDQASESMQESKDQLDKKQNSKSKSAQQNASDQLKKMAKSLQQKASGMDMEQLDIDIKATRQLLTNLLRLSFDQEALMHEVRGISPRSKAMPELLKRQNQLKEAGKLVRDSLFALSKRVMQLGPSINKETAELEKRLADGVRFMEDRQINAAGMSQQYAMTSSNNLALILNDLLSNLLQSQAEASGKGEGQGQGKGQGQGQGQSSGKSKGNGGEGAGGQMKDIITGQQQLGKGLNELRKMQQGKQPGNGSGEQGEQGEGSGESGGQGGSGSGSGDSERTAELLSRMAYEQSKLRQQIQELNSLMNSKGIKGNAKMMREIQEQMDRMETDLINRNISDDLLQRQNDILTRMLKAEEAIRQQEMDDQRQGETGRDIPRAIPPELQKYIDEAQQLKEKYHTVPPELKPFYKRITDNYLNKISS